MREFLNNYFNLKLLVEKTRTEKLKTNIFLLFAILFLLFGLMLLQGDFYTSYNIYVVAVGLGLLDFIIIILFLLVAFFYNIFTPRQITYTDMLRINLSAKIIDWTMCALISFLLSWILPTVSSIITSFISTAIDIYVIFQIKRVYCDVPCKRIYVLVVSCFVGLINSLCKIFGIL